MIAYIEQVGLQAPGLENWASSQTILRGETPYEFQPLSKYLPGFLPANERRRTTDTIRLALRTAEDTCARLSDDSIATLPTIFATVDGDTEIAAKMTHEILQENPMISPIHFHNSVHNAPAGYWMIGKHNQQAASSISIGEYQLANTFIESLTQLSQAQPRLMLVMYDLPIDKIIKSFQPKTQPFAFGLIFSLEPTTNSLAQLTLSLQDQTSKSEIDPWFGENAAAQFLPFLKALAQHTKHQDTFAISKTLSAKLTLEPYE